MKIYPEKYAVYAHYVEGMLIYVGMGKGGRFSQTGPNRTKAWNRSVDGSPLTIKLLAWYDNKIDALLLEARAIVSMRPKLNKPLKTTIKKVKGEYRIEFNEWHQRVFGLKAGQQVSITVGEDRDRCGILVVPIRETLAEGGG